MSDMQYDQPRGLASAAQQHQYQAQYTNPQSLPQSNANYYPQGNHNSEMSSPPVPGQNPYPQQHTEHEVVPPLPQRHQDHFPSSPYTPDASSQHPQSTYEQAPPLPQRHQSRDYFPPPPANNTQNPQTAPTGGFSGYQPTNLPPPVPIYHPASSAAGDDPSDPVHYTRDPHKLVGYLVPFPKPHIKGIDPNTVPSRFLIYTPPPPPLSKPKEGEKEAKLHKVQRKWQEEVRSAKTSTAPLKSWQGVKSRATKAIAWGVNQTTTSNLEFLGRVSDGSQSDSSRPTTPNDPSAPAASTNKTVGVNQMLLVYPPSMNLTPPEMRTEFVNSMLRTKSKAQRDTIIATGLLPVGFGIDILATLIWPFGGLGEIDTVWLYSSARGAKTAHSVTKRLASGSDSGDLEKDTLHLDFVSSQRIDVLTRYLEAECHKADSTRFPTARAAPSETEVLQAIGWHPSQTGGEQKNWEDEQWEMTEVKDDVKSNMRKGAKEWKKFCTKFAKDPEKALKK